jgi:hypothetical protein
VPLLGLIVASGMDIQERRLVQAALCQVQVVVVIVIQFARFWRVIWNEKTVTLFFRVLCLSRGASTGLRSSEVMQDDLGYGLV